MNQSLIGMLYVASAAFLWSTSGLFIKQIPADPLFITAARALIAGLTFLPFIKLNRIRLDKYFFFYAIANALTVSTFVTANKMTTAANVIALQYTSPLYIFLLMLFTKKEKLAWRTTLPMFFVLIGISMFLIEPNTGSNTLGNIIALMSGVAMAASHLLLFHLRTSSTVEIVCLGNLATALLVLPFIPSVTANLAMDSTAWLSLLYLGAVQIGLANFCFATGLKYISVLNASIIALTEAVYNPIWVFVFLGEAPTTYGLVGGIVILAAVAADIILRNIEAKDKTKEQPEELAAQ